jgi:hypothetical protein
LIDSKDVLTYWHFLHFVLVPSVMKLSPSTITADFEKTLLQAIKEQFPSIAVIGCPLHFKQALRRRLIKLKIPNEHIYFVMQPGMFDSLTTILRNHTADRII